MKKLGLFYFILFLIVFSFIRVSDYLVHIFYYNVLEENARSTLPANVHVRKKSDDFTYTIKTNSLGLRNEESVLQSAKERILFLGDSFVFGDGLNMEDTFVKLVQNHFKMNGKEVETINAGKTGAGPRDYYNIYKKIVSKINPSSVVICFYTNDIIDMTEESEILSSFREKKKRNLLYKLSYLFFPYTTDFFLKVDLLKFTDFIQTDKGSITQITDKPVDEQVSFPSIPEESIVMILKSITDTVGLKLSYLEIQAWKEKVGMEILSKAFQGRHSIYHVLGGILYPTYFKQGIELDEEGLPKYKKIRKILEKIKSDTDERKIKLYVVYIPSEIQYDTEKFKLNERLGYQIKQDYLTSTSAFEAVLTEDCEAWGVSFLSLLEDFRKNANKKLVFDFDLHINQNGSRVAAERIYSLLNQ
jgi:hypothetical protein